MAIIYTDSKHYQNIANAIREKSGSAQSYNPSEMSAAINNLIDSTVNTFLENKKYEVTFYIKDSGVIEGPYTVQKDGTWTTFMNSLQNQIREIPLSTVSYDSLIHIAGTKSGGSYKDVAIYYNGSGVSKNDKIKNGVTYTTGSAINLPI